MTRAVWCGVVESTLKSATSFEVTMNVVACGTCSSKQVYKASVAGRAVAVKVQRPDLLEAVGLDFYLARAVAKTVTRLSRGPMSFGGRFALRSDLVAAVDEYGSRLFEELDYRIEVMVEE